MTYTIGTLAGLTGLSSHTIRAWEKRFQLLSPGRTATNRRIYDEKDLEHLLLLKAATEIGHSIGQVAHLSLEELRPLSNAQPAGRILDSRQSPDEAHTCLQACLRAVQILDPEALQEALVRGGLSQGILKLIDTVILPLIAHVEAGWVDGTVRISQEHMVSAVLRNYLDRVRSSLAPAPGYLRILVTTPKNQNHEIGALLAAIVATTQGSSVVYLGPNLPAAEIAEASRMSSVRAIALSLVYPTDDPDLPKELHDLRSEVGSALPIIVGGRAVEAYTSVLDEIGAIKCQDLDSLRTAVSKL